MRQALATVLFLSALAVAHADEPPMPPDTPVGADSIGRVRLVRDPGGHAAIPRRLTFTPDSKKLISTGNDCTVQVWDVVSRERLRVIRAPVGVDGQGGVAFIGSNPLAVDRKGERVAFCVTAISEKAKERVRWSHSGGYFEKTDGDNWNEITETKVFPFVEVRRTDELIELFDKNRKYTITLYSDRCTIKRDKAATAPLYRGTWDKIVSSTFVCSLETGEAQVLKHFGAHEFTPDGTALAFAEGHNVNVVKIDTGETLQTVKVASKENVVNLAFSPDGKTLAVVGSDAKVYLYDYDAATLKPNSTLTVPGGGINLRSVGWADDKTVVCRSLSGEKAVVVLDAVKGGLKHSYSLKELFSHLPEGERKEEKGEKKNEGLLEIQTLTGTTKVLIRVKYSLTNRESTNGHWPNANYLLDWATGEAGNVFTQISCFGCEAAAVAPDLSVAAQGDGDLNDIIMWDPKEGKPFKDGKEGRRLRAAVRGADGGSRSIRWRPDGNGFFWTKLADGADKRDSELDLATLTLRPLSGATRNEYVKKLIAQSPRDKAPKSGDPQRGIRWEYGPLTVRSKYPNLEISGGPAPITCRAFGAVSWDFTFLSDGRILSHPWGTTVLEFFDPTTSKSHWTPPLTRSYIQSLSVSPDGRYVLIGSADQTLTVFNSATDKVLLTVFPAGKDWIAWTPEGYYAATPGGERLMGWHFDNGPDQLASFYPAERFRKQLYREDVIKLVLEKGSVEEALKAANVALKKEGVAVKDGVAKVDKLLPPVVVLTVADESKKPTVKLKVSAKAGAAEQPITALRLFVDGRPFGDKNASITFEKGVLKDEREWSVVLPPGKHRVVVLARSADASSSSNEEEIDCRAAANKPVLHVLAIGVNEYQDKDLNLLCAANDAELLATTFKSQCKGKLFGEVRPTILLDKDATRAAILADLDKLRTNPNSKVKANDLVVVFFAGHGAKEKDQFYLLTHETNVNNLAKTALSGKDLRHALGAFPCQVLLMMDACHSGAFGEKGKLSEKNLRPATDDATRTLTEDEVGVAVMCAAMGNETAAERGGNGLFTKAVVEGLTANKDVPYNHVNHRQYVRHLESYVIDRVSAESGEKQHPFLHLPWVVQSFPLRDVAAK